MKNYKFILALLLLNFNILAQVSVSDLKKLSNAQLDMIREELTKPSSLPTALDDSAQINSNNAVSSTISASTSVKISKYFGYDYFSVDKSFFDNLPVPKNYILGPGDKIILSFWGEVNSREEFVLNKEGLFFYPSLGFINISNMTIEEAEKVLKQSFSKIYSTLTDDSLTNLRLEIADLKSINVYFTGQFSSPGINIIHPFSDIFLAIIQAGGINQSGSLRGIQLIRDGSIVETFDFYNFFVKGENTFSDARILDGDIIHIPTVSKRVFINGDVYTDGYFELLDKESLSDLVNYTGGLKPSVSSVALVDQIIPQSNRANDENAMSSRSILIKDFDTIIPNNGDRVNIRPVFQQNTKVRVMGRVLRPGEYPSSSSLRGVLDNAGGFNNPIFRKSILEDEILVLRKDEEQFYAKEFMVSYNDSEKFSLLPGDQIFIYENINYNNLLTVTVTGEVNKAGSFQIKNNLSVSDAIEMAGGFTELANPDGVIVTEIFSSFDISGNEITDRIRINDITLDFTVNNSAIIDVLPSENVVKVTGNVYNPGLVVYSSPATVKRFINLAGGIKPDSLRRKIYVTKANGKIQKTTVFNSFTLRLSPGDTVFVPADPDPMEFDPTTFLSDLTSTLANVAALLVIVNSTND
jgi:protein involved in polysaccharide export with SLBB domain